MMPARGLRAIRQKSWCGAREALWRSCCGPGGRPTKEHSLAKPMIAMGAMRLGQ